MINTSTLAGMRLRPGFLIDAVIPPVIGDDQALRGRRPAIVVGEDERGILVIPISSGKAIARTSCPVITEPGIYGQARVDNPRWIERKDIVGLPKCSQLRSETVKAVLEAARETLISASARELYRAAKRSI